MYNKILNDTKLNTNTKLQSADFTVTYFFHVTMIND